MYYSGKGTLATSAIVTGRSLWWVGSSGALTQCDWSAFRYNMQKNHQPRTDITQSREVSMSEKHKGKAHYLAPSCPPVVGRLSMCLPSTLLWYVVSCSSCKERCSWELGVAEFQLQFIGRSEGDGLCLKRPHVAKCHTFFALRNKITRKAKQTPKNEHRMEICLLDEWLTAGCDPKICPLAKTEESNFEGKHISCILWMCRKCENVRNTKIHKVSI